MKRLKIDLTKPPCWREQASNVADWDRWDREMRRKLGWRAGLSFWSKTNVPGSRSLLARHWPHRLCWSWSIWVGKRREGYDGPKQFLFFVQRRYRYIDIRLWWFKIHIHWQDSDWMPGINYRDAAPEICWKHHLEHAEPAGTA